MITALVLTLTTQAPIVIAPGAARPVVVVLDGQAYSLVTTPLTSSNPEPPPPKPPEPPTPVEGVLWVSVIVDASDPKQAALRTHDAVRGLAKPGAINLRTYSHDDPALVSVKLAPYVTQHGMPTLIVQDNNGKVLSSGKAADAAGIVSEVKKYKP